MCEYFENEDIISAISTMYTTIMVIELKSHRYRMMKSRDMDKAADTDRLIGNFDDVREDILKFFVHQDMRDEMRTFIDFDTLSERMGSNDTIVAEYKNNQGEWLEARFIAQHRDEQGKVLSVLYVSRDISQEKEKEVAYKQKLWDTAVEAEKANISKTNFLRRMSHDIRTPLNGIIGMLHISQRHRNDPEKLDECLTKIERSADYLLELVNNVLDISKLESGAIELEHKPFELDTLLLNTLPMIETAANEHSIRFYGGKEDFHIQHHYVVGSPIHLNRVLMNIASNAIKYNRAGGSIKIHCEEIACDDDSATYEFYCEDTGLGMSEEFQKRAFMPFAQEGKETTTSFSGSGLGLSIVKEIVEKMGGTIDLNSEEGVGTTIKVTLTMALDKSCPLGEKPQVAEADIDVSGRRVLLVEDNDLNMEIARILLEEKGLVITEAKNGLTALFIFRESEPYYFDYIFMDMMMPVMDGIDATRGIRSLKREDAGTIPIIAMTANAFAEDKKSCIDAGMNDHISKPIDPQTLNKVIQRYANPHEKERK